MEILYETFYKLVYTNKMLIIKIISSFVVIIKCKPLSGWLE